MDRTPQLLKLSIPWLLSGLLLWWLTSAARESFRLKSPQIHAIPQFSALAPAKPVNVNPSPTHSRKAGPQGLHTIRTPTVTDLVMEPGIAHSAGLSGSAVGLTCSSLCDFDGTCHSAAFFDCIHADTSSYGRIGRERNTYDHAFRRMPYDQISRKFVDVYQ